MSKFEDGSYGSSAGIALIGKVLAGRCEMKYTRAAVGSGAIPDDMTPKTMTGPAGYVMDCKIAAITNPVDGECQVTIQIKSDDVENGFYATSIVLYAEDPDVGEVPYTYLVMENEPEWIRPSSSVVGKLATFDLIAAVGAIDKVAATIAPDSLINHKVFEETLKEFREQILKETAALGRVRIGNEETLLDPNDTLFLVDGWYPKKFEGAAYLDMVFQEDSPQGRERNWAKMPLTAGNRDSPENPDIISGKLAVAEEAPSGTAFFAKIN